MLAGQGLTAEIAANFPEWLAGLRLWDGRPVPAELQARCLREFERYRFVDRQIQDLQTLRRQRIRDDNTAQVEKVRRLLNLAGIGLNGSWLLVYELFGWRTFANRRELASLLGLTPTPYNSGGSSREQGISKAGNKRLRRMMVELAWCWLRWQPESELAKWFAERFARDSPRARKVGIVAVARKLTIALWKYLERGEVPAGAKEVNWRAKAVCSASAAA